MTYCGKTFSGKMFALAAGLVVATSSMAKADVIVTVGGTQYDVTTVTGTFASLASQLESTPWWNDATNATSFANAVGSQLGFPNAVFGDVSNSGPWFAYGIQSNHVNTLFEHSFNGSTNLAPVTNSLSLSGTYAVIAAAPVPEPATLGLLMTSLLPAGWLLGRRRSRRG